MRQAEREKEARLEIEKSLRDRINELENLLATSKREQESLRSERLSVSDSESESRRILIEQDEVDILPGYRVVGYRK